MKLRTSLATTTAAIALSAASTAQAGDAYLSFFGGIATFDDEIKFETSQFNPGFSGSAFGFATAIAKKTVCTTVGKLTTGGYNHVTTSGTTTGGGGCPTATPAIGFNVIVGHFYFGSAKYGTSGFTWENDFDNGYVIGGAFGTEFWDGFRGELELAYRHADVDNGARITTEFDGRNIKTGHVMGTLNAYRYTSGTPGITVIAGNVPIGPVSIPQSGTNPAFPFTFDLPTNTTRVGTASTHGEVDVWSFMANVWVDIDPFGINPDGVTTFIGGGIGIANADLSYKADFGTLLGGSMSYILDDNESAIAYQLGAGIGFDLGGGIALSAQYRWFGTDDIELGNTDYRVESHNLMVGLNVPMNMLLP